MSNTQDRGAPPSTKIKTIVAFMLAIGGLIALVLFEHNRTANFKAISDSLDVGFACFASLYILRRIGGGNAFQHGQGFNRLRLTSVLVAAVPLLMLVWQYLLQGVPVLPSLPINLCLGALGWIFCGADQQPAAVKNETTDTAAYDHGSHHRHD